MTNLKLKGAIIAADGAMYRFAARLDKPAPMVSEVVHGKRELPEADQRTWAALPGVDNYKALFGDAEKS